MENDDYYDLKIILWLILFLVFGSLLSPANTDRQLYHDCSGPFHPIRPDLLLEHEHILSISLVRSTGYFRWNRAAVIEKVLLLSLMQKQGSSDIHWMTPIYWAVINSAKGNFLKNRHQFYTNTGFYGAGIIFHNAGSLSLTAAEIANAWIMNLNRDWETGIKPDS